jgi:hypothetical protein
MSGKKTIYIQDDVLKDLEQDTFGHKHIAGAVVESILHTAPPYIIGIFGGWGTGKSSLLEMIKASLPGDKTKTVTIDAWRYSSSDNLRRAFLVHVAKELAPNMLDDLRRKLYSSEEETLPGKSSEFDQLENKPKFRVREVLSQILRSSLTFLGIAFMFLVSLFILYSIKTIMQGQGIRDFIERFDWNGWLNSFLNLAFIPLLLTVMDYLRLYIFQRPVTITHERIDADELFTEYFGKVVNEASGHFPYIKKLVIFVDNLDRLTDDKMVEALESLKTFINNDNCVFVVACDDRVVRSVINSSDKIPNFGENEKTNGRAGEHYLDKFFQQTFRLPEYMSINLHDFAERNFETTQLYEKLKSQKVDIRNLISIIIPSDVNSPRKIKRLLNEFITLYEIVMRREDKKDGQIRPGLLTDNVEFLGKYSTLRSEYPEFYKSLVMDTGLLQKITELIQKGTDEAQKELNDLEIENSDSLFAFLRKTQTILVDDIEPYIFLSQDKMALGLKADQNNQLRISLSNGDIKGFKSIFDIAANDDERVLLAQVASHMIEQRLAGIEQQNGVKVLAHLLPEFDPLIRQEIAHVVTGLIPRWPVDAFSAGEILNVLRFAQRGGINTQKQKLLDHIMTRLQNDQLRKATFEAVLQNVDVLQETNTNQRVQEWLASTIKALIKDETSPNKTEDTVLDQKMVEINSFIEWLISQVEAYSNRDEIVDRYFSTNLLDYMFSRLLGDIKGLETLDLGSDGMGETIQSALSVIENRIKAGVENKHYWQGVCDLTKRTNSIQEIQYCYIRIRELISYLPDEYIEKLMQGVFLGLENLVEVDDNNKTEVSSLSTEATEISLLLRRHKGKGLDKNELKELPAVFSKLFSVVEIQTSLLSLVGNFSKEFGKEDGEIFISCAIEVFTSLENNLDESIIVILVNLNEFMSQDHRKVVLSKINKLVMTNDPVAIQKASSFIEKIGVIPEYKQEFAEYIDKWTGIIIADVPDLLQMKLQIYVNLVKLEIFNSDKLIEHLIPLFPFAGNQPQLLVVIDELSNITKYISSPDGVKLFQIIMPNIEHFSPYKNRALAFIVSWIEYVDDGLRDNFNSQVQQQFKNSPNEYFIILSSAWKSLESEQIQAQIIQFFTVDIDVNYNSSRDLCTTQGLEAVNKSNRSGVVLSIWSQLISLNRPAESFMHIAVKYLRFEELSAIRQSAIDTVREHGASQESENNLRLLVATIRDDTRDLMPMVDLFINLFGRGQSDVRLALNYVVPCLQPLQIRNDHKHKLAEAMGQAALRTDEKEVNDAIHEKADQLGLKWFWYRKHWK